NEALNEIEVNLPEKENMYKWYYNLFLISNDTDKRVGNDIENEVEEEKFKSIKVLDNDDFIANTSLNNPFLVLNNTNEKAGDNIIKSEVKEKKTQVNYKESIKV
ncbi:720_t:CDS:2, partial [Funneliformis mosseae]